MSQRDRTPRVFACTGSVQLVTAVVAGRALADEAQDASADVLVIHDVLAPSGQELAFVRALRSMAERLGRWERVVYLSPAELAVMARVEGREAATRLHRRLGTSCASSLFLTQNPFPAARLLAQAFPGASRVCYGDSFGINFSPAYFSPDATHGTGLLARLRRRCAARVQHAGQSGGAGQTEPAFDCWALLLPNAFDQRVSSLQLDPDQFRSAFETLGALAGDPPPAVASGQPAMILLSTNFSESRKMSRPAELRYQAEFVQRQAEARESVLFLKPHPRDDRRKLVRLAERLERLCWQVVILNGPNHFHLPFETLFCRWFAGRGAPVVVLGYSTACLSLELLYRVQCRIGFGEEVVRRAFEPSWIGPRLRHERDLERVTSQVRADQGR